MQVPYAYCFDPYFKGARESCRTQILRECGKLDVVHWNRSILKKSYRFQHRVVLVPAHHSGTASVYSYYYSFLVTILQINLKV